MCRPNVSAVLIHSTPQKRGLDSREEEEDIIDGIARTLVHQGSAVEGKRQRYVVSLLALLRSAQPLTLVVAWWSYV